MTEASTPGEAMILAMWSGPRNLSTALMRSFAQRADCRAWDEPFYAAYLSRTGLPHPMREEVIAAGITDPDLVAKRCLENSTKPTRIFYQKHMAHHMVEGFPTNWIDDVINAFLIRAPERVLASYVRKHDEPTPDDIGFHKLHMLFERTADRIGRAPPVVDAEDIRSDPEGVLIALCDALDLPFDPAMLSWDPGPRPEDGVWGKHWYDTVWSSRGFGPPSPPPDALPDRLAPIADQVREPYQALARHRLRPGARLSPFGG